MKTPIRIFLLFLVTLSAGFAADDYSGILSQLLPEKYKPEPQQTSSWRKDGESAPDTPNMKSKDGFGAQLFLTEGAQFFEDWNKPETPNLIQLSKAHRNVMFYTVILFVDPGTDAAGVADITCDIVIRKPDGEVYGQAKDMVCWKAKNPAPAHNLQLSQGHMGIRIEPQDPSGTYTVEATVRDNIKKVELPLKTTFEVGK